MLKTAHSITILHVEDNRFVAGVVAETLALKGWRVVTVTDGRTGMRQIEGDAHYDLVILDYDLPVVDGLDLARRARGLEHRRGTPIVMLSAAVVGMQAGLAGINVFLRKPENINLLVDTVRCLAQSWVFSISCA